MEEREKEVWQSKVLKMRRQESEGPCGRIGLQAHLILYDWNKE